MCGIFIRFRTHVSSTKYRRSKTVSYSWRTHNQTTHSTFPTEAFPKIAAIELIQYDNDIKRGIQLDWMNVHRD